jgi:hypothetical protein
VKRIKESYGLVHESMNDALDLYVKHQDRKDGKCKGDSWRDCDIGWLDIKLAEEFSEYLFSGSGGKDRNRKELLDVINVAAMLAARLKLDGSTTD